MPSMYVNVPRLEQETKNTLVAKLYDAAAPVLKAPHIYTFVNEYETLYENGQPAPQKMVVANSPSRRRRSMPSPRACARRCGRFWERTRT